MEIYLVIVLAAVVLVGGAAFFIGKKSVHIPDRSSEIAAKDARIEELLVQVRDLTSQRDVSRANEENARTQLEAEKEDALQAKAEAAKIVKQAEDKAADTAKNSMTEISLAGKQALAKIKNEIADAIIAKSVNAGVAEAVINSRKVIFNVDCALFTLLFAKLTAVAKLGAVIHRVGNDRSVCNYRNKSLPRTEFGCKTKVVPTNLAKTCGTGGVIMSYICGKAS